MFYGCRLVAEGNENRRRTERGQKEVRRRIGGGQKDSRRTVRG